MPLACRIISNVALWLSKICVALLLYVVDQEYLAYKMHFTDLFSWHFLQIKCLEPLGLSLQSKVASGTDRSLRWCQCRLRICGLV